MYVISIEINLSCLPHGPSWSPYGGVPVISARKIAMSVNNDVLRSGMLVVGFMDPHG